MSNKVFIYAWDGADPQYISKFLNKGLLPNLRKLKDNFFHSLLYSVKPANSPVAWSSFFTGINPGKHGVFGWRSFNIETGEFRLNNFNSIHGQTIPETLSRNNTTIGLIGFPLMYPALKINGFWIPGSFGPGESSSSGELVYPCDILGELDKNNIELELQGPSIDLKRQNFDEYAKENAKRNRNRVRAAVHLYRAYNLKCTLVLNSNTDHINHEASDFRYIERAYADADIDLGYILDNLDSDTIFMLISDHGSIRCNKEFYVNNLLYKKGFIRLHNRLPKTLENQFREKIEEEYGKGLSFVFKLTPQRVKLLLKRIRCNQANIDFKNTLAYNPECEGQIYLRRNTDGVKEYIIGILEKLEIVDNIYTNEEVYHGPFANDGPDILFDLNDSSCYTIPAFDGVKYYSKDVSCGGHSETGIIYSNIDKNKVKERNKYSLLDIMPTILSIMDIPIPTIVDGQNISELDEKYEEVDEELYLAPRESVEYDAKEVGEIEKRLKALGYL